MLFVGGFGGLLEFAAGLVEQLLGFTGVSIHVEFIGLLSSLNFFEGLVAQTLRRSQVWVSFRTDVFGGWFHLCVDETPEQQSNPQHAS